MDEALPFTSVTAYYSYEDAGVVKINNVSLPFYRSTDTANLRNRSTYPKNLLETALWKHNTSNMV